MCYKQFVNLLVNYNQELSTLPSMTHPDKDKTCLQASDYKRSECCSFWNSIWCFLFEFRDCITVGYLKGSRWHHMCFGLWTNPMLPFISLHAIRWPRSLCSDWKITVFSLASHLWFGFSDHRVDPNLWGWTIFPSFSVTMVVPKILHLHSLFFHLHRCSCIH